MDGLVNLISANLTGVYLTVREGAKRLIASGRAKETSGRVVIIGSIIADDWPR